MMFIWLLFKTILIKICFISIFINQIFSTRLMKDYSKRDKEVARFLISAENMKKKMISDGSIFKNLTFNFINNNNRYMIADENIKVINYKLN